MAVTEVHDDQVIGQVASCFAEACDEVRRQAGGVQRLDEAAYGGERRRQSGKSVDSFFESQRSGRGLQLALERGDLVQRTEQRSQVETGDGVQVEAEGAQQLAPRLRR